MPMQPYDRALAGHILRLLTDAPDSPILKGSCRQRQCTRSKAKISLMRGYFPIVAALTALALAAGAPAGQAAPGPSAADQGAAALIRGDTAAAVVDYTEALKDTALSNDRRASILNDRGVAYMRLGQAKLALEDFNRAVQLFPEYAAIYNNRGNLLLSLGLAKEAIRDFDRAVLLAPGYAAAYNNRAGAFAKLGQMAEAIKDYTQAVQLAPQGTAPLSGRGRIHLALGRPNAAIRDFTRAVNADARFAAGYRSRAEAKLEVELYDEAIEDLSRAIAFDVNNAEIYLVRGQAYLATGNMASAIKDFAQAVTLDAKLAPAYCWRGLAHTLAEAYEEAFADLNRAIEIDPRSAVAFAFRAFAYKQSGQADVGLKDVQTAAKLEAERAEVYWAKAEVGEALGLADQAVTDLRKALALRPAFTLARDALGRLGGDIAAETVVPGMGLGKWQVIERAGRYFAVNDDLPRLRVPLEMWGEGRPKILEWQLKEPPLAGIGILRFHSGSVASAAGKDEVEHSAIIDLEQGTVVAVETHRIGDRTANWTWDEGKVVVASADGVTDELVLRTHRDLIGDAQGQRRLTGSETSAMGWAPWSSEWGLATTPPPRQQRPKKKKSKTLFDLLFN